jgi:chromosome condensin MukBEF MukE localization factor
MPYLIYLSCYLYLFPALLTKPGVFTFQYIKTLQSDRSDKLGEKNY